MADDQPTAEWLIRFLRKHLAREKSRPLIVANLAFDFGLESSACKRSVDVLVGLVDAGRRADASVALATELWSHFVDHLEGEGGSFRIDAYVDEVYLTILARLLSANALAGTAIVSGDVQLRAILNGFHFRTSSQLDNLVEKDYFGWIAEPSHIGDFLPVARAIQRDFYAYDVSWRREEDLFGRLPAQLARRSQRKLLGQEWTPSWLARHLAERCLDGLPESEAPEIVDMCCGSGSILAEVIKAAKERYGYDDIVRLGSVVTGFDIDPLAVAFAKTTWVITLTNEINAAKGPITIPVYHADSLFAVTPVSTSLPMLGERDEIDIALDGQTVRLPAGMLQPSCRELFDRLIDWAYDEAQQHGGELPTADDARAVFDVAAVASGVTPSQDLREASAQAVLALARRMKELADAGRNGIWAFILRNTYRPSLLAGRFNGLVSNPPWLAMSALADNPYRELLSRRAALYGVKPAGQSFFHLELGTTHLLHAVDRYLKPGAAVACLVPGTILNGHHHERFRQRRYIGSERPVPFNVTEVWQIAHGTFKYPGAALIGTKTINVADAYDPVGVGAVTRQDEVEIVDFAIREIGMSRTAWVHEKNGLRAALAGGEETFIQGADIMPRATVCIDILNEAGNEYRVNTPTPGSRWHFALKRAKEVKEEKFPGYVAPCFIHRMAQSENLLPFVFGPHRAPVAIPACRDEHGVWQVFKPADIRRMGFTRTARRFAWIDEKLATIGDRTLAYRIDFRRKLSIQNFGNDGFVVMSGAGGKYICAACMPVGEAATLVIDQTLYWQVVVDENDAWFKVGFLHSATLTEAILPFNPEGEFGPRHIHTLPCRLMPPYDSANEVHRAVAEAARTVGREAAAIAENDDYIGDPNRSLPVRRRKLRERLAERESFQELDRLCGTILGINPGEQKFRRASELNADTPRA